MNKQIDEKTAAQQLAEIRKKAVERQKKSRQKRLEQGWRTVSFELPPDAAKVWQEHICEEGESLGQAVRRAAELTASKFYDRAPDEGIDMDELLKSLDEKPY